MTITKYKKASNKNAINCINDNYVVNMQHIRKNIDITQAISILFQLL